MMSYAFQSLKSGDFVRCGTEDFENVRELMAAILYTGIMPLLKQGLRRDYTPHTEELTCPRGKIDITASLRNLAQRKQKLICNHDDFSENILINKILKTTIILLLRTKLSSKRACELRRLLPAFHHIKEIPVAEVFHNKFPRTSNRNYNTLLQVCKFVLNGLLQSPDKGDVIMRDFLDSQSLARLYEKFILKYFAYHHPKLNSRSEYIDWALDCERVPLLPRMLSDITLSCMQRTLIIDAKFYGNNISTHFNSPTLHSANLYQLYAYLDNYQRNNPDLLVEGMLLYARTSQNNLPDFTIPMKMGNIYIKTLNLNQDFSLISQQLNDIAATLYTGRN